MKRHVLSLKVGLLPRLGRVAALAALAWVGSALAQNPGDAAVTGRTPSANTARNGQWYVNLNMETLGPHNRYLSSVLLTNPGTQPIYIKTAVSELASGSDGRQRSEHTEGALRVFPQQIILQPGQSFPARLIFDPAKLQGTSRSFYVNFTDVSQKYPDNLGGGVANGTLLGYDVMVSAVASVPARLPEAELKVRQVAPTTWAITNNAGYHLYLNEGRSCPSAATQLVDCQPLPKFPRQSMLPGETLEFAAEQMLGYLGLLYTPTLNSRGGPVVAHLPVAWQ